MLKKIISPFSTGLLLLMMFFVSSLFMSATTVFAENVGRLSLDVVPSPFAINLKANSQTMLEMQIRNAGKGTEKLKIEPKAYMVDENGAMKIDNNKQPDFSSSISIKSPKFTLEPGEWLNQEVVFTLAKDTDFNYPFYLLISRDNGSPNMSNDTVSVPVFINVDKQAAKRKIEVLDFSAISGIYDNLPGKLTLKVKNTGNTIIMPSGNIFLYKGTNNKPIATIPINPNKEYVIPGNTKVFKIGWADNTKKDSQFFGDYKAKLVAIYNDGLKDVKIEREVTAKLFPRSIIFGLVAATALFILLIVALLLSRRAKK